MKRQFSFILRNLALITIIFIGLGCEDKNFITEPDQQTSIKDALEKITYSDEALNSFIPNYNEEEALSLISGQLGKTIYPIKVGQVVNLVNRNLQIDYGLDTAIGFLTLKFEGQFIVVGSFSNNSKLIPDTVIKKPFTSIITRKIKYAKIDSTGDNLVDWKVVGSSLPAGGTETNNIEITKVIITTIDGNTIIITSPNDYFFDFGRIGYALGKDSLKSNRNQNRLREKLKFNNMIPFFNKKQPVTITVEIKSKYEKTDFLTLTHGGMVSAGMYRTKEKFELKDTQFDGIYYIRTYEKTWITHIHPGFMHVVINLLPNESVTDSEFPIEEKTWGIPYAVK